MQLRLPWTEPRPLGPARHIVIDGRPVPVTVVRHRRARRYIVRLAPDGAVRLTVPRGASIAGGLAFAARQADWIRRQTLRRAIHAAPWTSGTRVWFRGELVELVVTDDEVQVGSEIARRSGEPDVRAAVTTHLRTLAASELPPRCQALASEIGAVVARVSVRNQRSRWGACSARGVITLNWRLVQVPPSVSDYIILHELTHLRHPDHSPRFWRDVERVCAWWRDGERWLRRYGREVVD